MLNEYKGDVQVGDIYYIYWSPGNENAVWRKCKCINNFVHTKQYHFEFYDKLDQQDGKRQIFKYDFPLFISENINSIAPGPSVPSTRLSTKGGKRTTKKKRPKQI